MHSYGKAFEPLHLCSTRFDAGFWDKKTLSQAQGVCMLNSEPPRNPSGQDWVASVVRLPREAEATVNKSRAEATCGWNRDTGPWGDTGLGRASLRNTDAARPRTKADPRNSTISDHHTALYVSTYGCIAASTAFKAVTTRCHTLHRHVQTFGPAVSYYKDQNQQ